MWFLKDLIMELIVIPITIVMVVTTITVSLIALWAAFASLYDRPHGFLAAFETRFSRAWNRFDRILSAF
jgi:hypothetical protein